MYAWGGVLKPKISRYPTQEALRAFVDTVCEETQRHYPTKDLWEPIADALIKEVLGEVSYADGEVRQYIPSRNIMSAEDRTNHMYALRGRTEEIPYEDIRMYIIQAPQKARDSMVLKNLMSEQEDKAETTYFPDATEGEERKRYLKDMEERVLGDTAQKIYKDVLAKAWSAMREMQQEQDGFARKEEERRAAIEVHGPANPARWA